MRNEEADLASLLDNANNRLDRWLANQPDAIDLSAVLASSEYREFTEGYRQIAQQLDEEVDAEQVERDANQLARFSTASEISHRLRGDLPFVLTRLIGAEPDLYSAVDRRNTEGEFRAAVSLPLATLVCIVAALYQPLVLLGLALPCVLFWLGLQRRRDALLTLAQALYSGRVWSPVLGGPFSGVSKGKVDMPRAEPVVDHEL
ncbi:hypothetical protein GCM10009661_75010 [Catellatospora chokoriensis]|uniref:Uncharacterized protein n=1 Tax=Catellatospora chokoriensis TaxID=310353 RepID=A0A8J3KFC5_9ACTN|nr:hypothetical protein Cch02nite_83080 [Catellatospora chokoriensis]